MIAYRKWLCDKMAPALQPITAETRKEPSSGDTWMYDLEHTCSTGSITPTTLTDTVTGRSSSGCK